MCVLNMLNLHLKRFSFLFEEMLEKLGMLKAKLDNGGPKPAATSLLGNEKFRICMLRFGLPLFL